jgi:hypothetical protein
LQAFRSSTSTSAVLCHANAVCSLGFPAIESGCGEFSLWCPSCSVKKNKDSACPCHGIWLWRAQLLGTFIVASNSNAMGLRCGERLFFGTCPGASENNLRQRKPPASAQRPSFTALTMFNHPAPKEKMGRAPYRRPNLDRTKSFLGPDGPTTWPQDAQHGKVAQDGLNKLQHRPSLCLGVFWPFVALAWGMATRWPIVQHGSTWVKLTLQSFSVIYLGFQLCCDQEQCVLKEGWPFWDATRPQHAPKIVPVAPTSPNLALHVANLATQHRPSRPRPLPPL